MAGLAASSLYHYTSFEALQGILNTRGFWPQLAMEEMPVLGPSTVLAVPMVCFCDIRLTQVGDHIKHYQPYAIGLTKYWAKRASINPVMYLEHGSQASNTIASTIGLHWKKYDSSAKALKLDDLSRETLKESLKFLCFCKRSTGRRWNKIAKEFDPDRIIRFYDEREWRFVSSKDLHSQGAVIPLNYHVAVPGRPFDWDGIDRWNEELRQNPLSFTGVDISHIVVRDESEVQELIDTVKWTALFNSEQQFVRRIRVYSEIEEDY